MGLFDGIMKVMGRQVRKPDGWFGRLMGHGMARGHRPQAEWAIRLMDIQPTDRVLDVGCGSGMAVKLISQMAVEGFVAGVDYSAIMVAQARQRNRAAVRAGRVAIQHGNVAALPYEDDAFDKVIGVETFYFWPDPVASLKEVCRVLRPGGLVALMMEGSKESPDWQKMAARAAQMEFPIYAGAEMAEFLTAAGFSRAWYEARPDEGWGWLCVLGTK